MRIFTAVLLLFSNAAGADVALSNLAIYNRCHAQLTGERPLLSDSLTQQVQAGTLDPIAACTTILNGALLNSSGGLANVNDARAKKVLRTLHNVHGSWFARTDFQQVFSINSQQGAQDIYDSSMPALYFTRALLAPTSDITSVLNTSDILKPVRTNSTTDRGLASNMPLSEYQVGSYGVSGGIPFAPKGELLGMQTVAPLSLAYNSQYYGSGTARVYANAGGGVMGNYVYILQNASLPERFTADGGLRMPRRWARSVYHDLLCRDLPLIRAADSNPFVATGSSIAFRQSAACVRCHASMDRMASVIRNIVPKSFSIGEGVGGAYDFLDTVATSSTAESAWPTASDSNYHRRPTNGVLFFRNYQGALVDINVTDAQNLANQILAQDDFYICMAKRYYRYLTGVDADTGDIGDPDRAPLSTADMSHRTTVINLGMTLKTNRDVRLLIRNIMNLPSYKRSAAGQ